MLKIRCINPDHKDETASLVLYPHGNGYCFGCGTFFRNLKRVTSKPDPAVIKEDIEAKIKSIRKLPTLSYRGLLFHYDATGYYVLWPDNSYYKKRMFDETTRYKNPKGIKQPLLILSPNKLSSATKQLIIVEGEINALSIYSVDAHNTIVSAGGANQLNNVLKLKGLQKYKKILILVDKDKSGMVAGLALLEELKKINPKVVIEFMEQDANYMLAHYGKENLKKYIEKLGM